MLSTVDMINLLVILTIEDASFPIMPVLCAIS